MNEVIVSWPESEKLAPVTLEPKGRFVAPWGTRYTRHYSATVNGTEIFIGRHADTIWEVRLRRKNFQYLSDAAGLSGIQDQIAEKACEYALPLILIEYPSR